MLQQKETGGNSVLCCNTRVTNDCGTRQVAPGVILTKGKPGLARTPDIYILPVLVGGVTMLRLPIVRVPRRSMIDDYGTRHHKDSYPPPPTYRRLQRRYRSTVNNRRGRCKWRVCAGGASRRWSWLLDTSTASYCCSTPGSTWTLRRCSFPRFDCLSACVPSSCRCGEVIPQKIDGSLWYCKYS